MGTLANIGMVLGLGATVLAGSVAGVTVNNNKQLENDNKQLVVEVENAKEENSQLLDTNKLQETMIENLKTEKAILQTQVDTITAEKGELNTQLATEQEKYNTLVAEKTELTNIYNALVESNNLTLEEKAELETQIAEKQNQIDEQLINITALNSIIAEKDATILSLQNQLREVSKQIDEMTIEYRFSRVTVSVLLDSSFGFSLCDVSDFNTGRALKEIFSNFTTFQVYGVALEDNYNVNAGLANFFIVDRLPIQEGYADVELHLTFNGEEFNVDSLDDNTNYRYCSYFEFFYNANNEVSKVDIHTNFSLIEN